MPPARDDRAGTVFNTPGLVVTGASAEHMLAMKIDAARNSDEDDIGVLVAQLGITSADQALEIYRTVLPHTAAVESQFRNEGSMRDFGGRSLTAGASPSRRRSSTGVPVAARRAQFTVDSALGGVRDLTPYLTPYGADAGAISGRGWIRNSRIP